MRYLTSKDFRKDADGVGQLTDNDVRNIENGIANYNYIENPGFKTRIMKVMIAYRNYKKSGDANGSGDLQILRCGSKRTHMPTQKEPTEKR